MWRTRSGRGRGHEARLHRAAVVRLHGHRVPVYVVADGLHARGGALQQDLGLTVRDDGSRGVRESDDSL